MDRACRLARSIAAFFTLQNKDIVSFGLGPADTKLGDHVAVIFACSVPVVLREESALFMATWTEMQLET